MLALAAVYFDVTHVHLFFSHSLILKMSKPSDLPDDFFDPDKRSKKAQQDDLAKELEKFEEDMAALQAESDEQLREEFEKIQEEKNLDESDQQIVQLQRVIELGKKAEELKNKSVPERPPGVETGAMEVHDLNDIEEELSNWRSKGI